MKICGLRDTTSALAASEAGATAIGFMLAPSRRRIAPTGAREILERLPIGTGLPLAVGVVVNESPVSISRLVDETGLDLIQLSGDEEPSVLDNLQIRIWKVLRFPAGTGLDGARRAIEPWFDHARPVEAILLDASVAGHYGGTGHVADWDLAAHLAREYPVILAGGLNPENVATAIDVVRPFGVDVSSGVETDGIKDPARITAFVHSALAAFGSTSDLDVNPRR